MTLNPFRAGGLRCSRCGVALLSDESELTAEGQVTCSSCAIGARAEEQRAIGVREKAMGEYTAPLLAGIASLFCFCDPGLLALLTIFTGWLAISSLREKSGQTRETLGAQRYRVAWVIAVVGIVLGIARPLVLFIWAH